MIRAGRALGPDPRGDLAALAAVVEVLTPDLRTLAVRVRATLESLEPALASESEDFERMWVSTGAAALYDATVELVEVLATAVENLDV